MQNNLSDLERSQLDAVWQKQLPVDGPPLDFQGLFFPAAWARTKPGDAPTADEAAQLIQKTLGWPEWVRIYPKPINAVMAASKLARGHGLPGGVLWVAPGTGSPFPPAKGEPGLAILRADWAPDAQSMRQAQAEIRELGLLFVLDECATGFRLAPGGAREFYDLDPDVVFYGPALCAGLDIGILAGMGDPPDQAKKTPSPQALAALADVLPKAAQPRTAERATELGRLTCEGLLALARRAGLKDEVGWEGTHAMPRLRGRRLWAFIGLAKEEGLLLKPQVMPDLELDPAQAPKLLWPRLARACARLKVLPEGEKAPLGWADAMDNMSCVRVEEMLKTMDDM